MTLFYFCVLYLRIRHRELKIRSYGMPSTINVLLNLSIINNVIAPPDYRNVHLLSLRAHTGNAALQNHWSSSDFLNYYVHVIAQFLPTNDLISVKIN